MKDIIKRILTVITIFMIIMIPFKIVTADSGFDYDYDSGGSSGWSSSDSWSSSDDSWSFSSDSDMDYTDTDPIIIIIAFIVIIVVLIIEKMTVKSSMISQSYTPSNMYNKMSDDEIKAIDSELDTEIIVNKTFNLYKALQQAWMEFDNEEIRKLVSDELYNNYKMQLSTLEKHEQKNIMEDITKVNGFVTSVRKEGKIESVGVILNITMKDYIVDKKGNVVRGDKYRKGIAYYILIDKVSDELKRLTNCPNCGHILDDEASQECKYCGSNLVLESKDFIITKKQNIGQGNENYSYKPPQENIQVQEPNINKYDKIIDNSMFKTKVDNIFVQLYTGLSNGDLKDVRHKISDEVFNKYQKEVEENENNNIKQLFDELNVRSTEIINIENSNDMIIVKVKLISRYIDYCINKDSGTVVRGNNKHRVEHTNILTLQKKNNTKNIGASLHCPGCGKPMNVNESGNCKYCGTTFNTEDYDYVLTDIEVK